MAQNEHLSPKTGVEAVVTTVGEYAVTATTDGLEFASPSSTPDWFINGIKMSARLVEFLTDIRLLRRIPLSYLVPDARLLPPESIRFFHVNQTWVDRVIDGVVSNTNLGTVDFHRSLTVLQAIREQVNPAEGQMTGMLIRSELVRRWPKMIVRAYSVADAEADSEQNIVETLRAEPVSRDVFIALFDGEPASVHLREPFEGVRYGVEFDDNRPVGQEYTVDRRNPDGSEATGSHVIGFHDQNRRTIDVRKLSDDIVPGSAVGDSRAVALHLEQRPYIQVFRQPSAESGGSKPAPPEGLLLRNGHRVNLKFAEHALFRTEPD
ncbi:hypothetical protein [Mycolicibacterium holsaticum]|uniref:hypothetical protein n=1 Tax=Mycolicibacterium holsaticum TaxID=152142 RepID=UPI001C7D84E0|nr:hypothetical protein [Mycolicibacterium holsaticum]MDA4107833.1 hypothetical protein [Mycolicibacterium holsaticum DSM 44478 = JCM 12374]QZA14724.1 hypothetical protein K3U96_11855 [Mycolicibacterium holsaticum DSM 44478 = JCM 12374]UNC07833.1 hypothetical protein H5U41_14980 [Mycolicibacterium holsaticum DSM 44478 = JCM 12374]